MAPSSEDKCVDVEAGAPPRGSIQRAPIDYVMFGN